MVKLMAFHPMKDRQESQSIKPLAPSLTSTHCRAIGHHIWRFYAFGHGNMSSDPYQKDGAKTIQKPWGWLPIPTGFASPTKCICAWCLSSIDTAIPMATPLIILSAELWNSPLHQRLSLYHLSIIYPSFPKSLHPSMKANMLAPYVVSFGWFIHPPNFTLNFPRWIPGGWWINSSARLQRALLAQALKAELYCSRSFTLRSPGGRCRFGSSIFRIIEPKKTQNLWKKNEKWDWRFHVLGEKLLKLN